MQPRCGWWDLAELSVFGGLFVWLRWYSSLWRNRWTDFGLGVALVSTNFNGRELIRQQLAFARNDDLQKGVTILGAVAFSVTGVGALKGVSVGPSFFLHAAARAGSDDGFFGVLSSVHALPWLYASWALLKKGCAQNSPYPVLPPRHG